MFNAIKPLDPMNRRQSELVPEAFSDFTPKDMSVIARSLTEKIFKSTHKELARSIRKHHVDGHQFLEHYHRRTKSTKNGQRFISWFMTSICGSDSGSNGRANVKSDSDSKSDLKSHSKSERKFGHFREWFMGQIERNDYDRTVLQHKDLEEFTKFVLDGFDEFIANIFVEMGIGGQSFINDGHRKVAQQIMERHYLVKGHVVNLCREMDDQMKTKKAEQMRRGRAPSVNWIIKPSVRELPSLPDSGKVEVCLVLVAI